MKQLFKDAMLEYVDHPEDKQLREKVLQALMAWRGVYRSEASYLLRQALLDLEGKRRKK